MTVLRNFRGLKLQDKIKARDTDPPCLAQALSLMFLLSRNSLAAVVSTRPNLAYPYQVAELPTQQFGLLLNQMYGMHIPVL